MFDDNICNYFCLKSSVDGEPRLQLELIDQLIDQLDMDSAAYWAIRCRLPVESLPHQVVSMLHMPEWYVVSFVDISFFLRLN